MKRDLARVVGSTAAALEHLSPSERVDVLCILLAQEVCMAPVSEREEMLNLIVEETRAWFDATEPAMRKVLIENARGVNRDDQ